VRPRVRCLSRGPGEMRSSDGVLVADGLLEIVNLIELVLEVDAAEEEGHDGAQADAKRLGAVEVSFDVVAEGEAGDEPDDPTGDGDEAAENTLMRVMVMAECNEDAVGAAEVYEDQDRSDDVVHEGFAGGLYALAPGGEDEVPKDDEEAAGEEAEKKCEAPVEIWGIGIDGSCGLRVGGCRRRDGGLGCGGSAEDLGDGEPVGHLVALGHVGWKDVAGGYVALKIFKGVGPVGLAVA